MQSVLIALVLLTTTVVVFWPLHHAGFINYDDNVFVSENPHLRHGLTWDNVRWAVTADFMANTDHADYWAPATFLSHLVTAQWFGLNPGAHHLVNVLLHALSAALLYAGLRRMTGAPWPSAVVAALFAVHPLHVESVAWVTERKDVLSGLFFMLTLLAYARYAERPAIARYLPVVLWLALGLMSKPMVVTTPFILLLLDYWPLNRVPPAGARIGEWLRAAWRLVWEKLPLFALSAGAVTITYLATQRGEAVASFQELPLLGRLVNALVCYAAYIKKMVWPDGLAVFYPYPSAAYPAWQVAGSALVLLGVSILVFAVRRTRPYALVGWCWYLGMLVPVIGLVQAGGQAMADRYTYLPLIGLFILPAWGLADVMAAWQHRRLALAAAAIVAIGACVFLTRSDLRHWRNSGTLFEQALRVTKNNYVAYNNLGLYRVEEGRFEEAIAYYRKGLLVWPNFPELRYNLGNALAHEGQYDEAVFQYTQAVQLSPNDAKAHNNLGMVLGSRGKLDEAIGHFTEALRINPDQALVHANLGLALGKQGRFDAAIPHLAEAVRLDPEKPDPHYNLGVINLRLGRIDEAVREFEAVLTLNPHYPSARKNLDLALQKRGKPREGP